MGIARAIRRVKRQAKQGGFTAVMTGLGEGLRSRAVPAPLRGAARKIAALIDPTRSPKSRPASTPRHTKHGTPSHEPLTESEGGGARARGGVAPIGVDSGAEPLEPADDTPVDAVRVGATPTYNATPVEVAPLDATPVEVTPIEVKPPLEVTLEDLPSVEAAPLGEEPELGTSSTVEAKLSAPVAKPSAPKNSTKKAAAAAPKPKTPELAKEKLAADGEAAKSVARSGSRTAKKPASTRADTTSKKK
ncbi:MAG: hypothetical protein JWN04_4228 [Myxococcaceae bacterium]|nr:hypothetical protein [Myxococcaceae bacterium]